MVGRLPAGRRARGDHMLRRPGCDRNDLSTARPGGGSSKEKRAAGGDRMMNDDTQGGFGAAGMWDTLAPTWDARGDWHARVTRDLTTRMVDVLDPSEGQ